MTLDRIILQNFRVFEQRDFSFHPQLTLIVGQNARGKTTLLEGIYTSVYGEGFRESKEEELIQWEKDISNVAGVFSRNGESTQFQVMLRNTGERVEKAYFVDRTKKSHSYYLQYQTRAVLFTPDNVELITGSPSERRSYVNRVLSASDMDYRKRLQNYENALRKRNKILETYRSESALAEELAFWDEYLSEQSAYLTMKRTEWVEYLNLHPDLDDRTFRIEYLKNELSVARLRERLDLEKRMRKTSVGPQKDDFAFHMTQGETTKNVQMYGSRSEQRLAVFWMKLNEIRYVEDRVRRRPILLLDDVFSELDPENKKRVMRLIDEYQTILTTTEEEMIEIPGGDKLVIRL